MKRRVAGVEPLSPSLEDCAPPAHDRLPRACVICGGWVPPVERVYTDEGLFHDRLSCLSEKTFDELVTRYGCRCDA